MRRILLLFILLFLCERRCITCVFFLNFVRMKLIADSGSTKTDWALVDDCNHSTLLKTQGLNPFHQSEEEMFRVFHDELLPQLCGNIREVFYYGSGVRDDQKAKMECLLRKVVPGLETIEVNGDLLGAARALCGRNEGIACILGTGANSCLFDGQRIIRNTPPLGYILGDEGSGAVLGIRFVNALYKGILSDTIRQDFEWSTGLSLSAIIERVYRQPLANRFLASLSVHIHRYLDDSKVRVMLTDHFRQFFIRNIAPYHRTDLPVSAVGSIAFYYQEQLQDAAKQEGYALGKIERSPLHALIEYHRSV